MKVSMLTIYESAILIYIFCCTLSIHAMHLTTRGIGIKGERVKPNDLPSAIEKISHSINRIPDNMALVKPIMVGYHPEDSKNAAEGFLGITYRSPYNKNPYIFGLQSVVSIIETGDKCDLEKEEKYICVSPFGGAMADQFLVDQDCCVKLPNNWTVNQGATSGIDLMVASSVIDSLLMKFGDLNGLAVRINGASGKIGTFLGQALKARGAKIYAVCGTASVNKMKVLGYIPEDYNKDNSGKPKVDAYIDLHGRNYFQEFKYIESDGSFITVVGTDTHGLKPGSFLDNAKGLLTIGNSYIAGVIPKMPDFELRVDTKFNKQMVALIINDLVPPKSSDILVMPLTVKNVQDNLSNKNRIVFDPSGL